MSYQEFRELYVVCDQCHTTLYIGDATYEEADDAAIDDGWQYDEHQDRHYCHLHWHVKCHDCNAADIGTPEELEYEGWRVDSDFPDENSLCPNHCHLACRECRKWDVGPRHRLEYEGWQVNAADLDKSLCPECVKTIGKEK